MRLIGLMAGFGELIDFRTPEATRVAWPEPGGVGGKRAVAIAVAPTVALLSMASLFVCASADRRGSSSLGRVSPHAATGCTEGPVPGKTGVAVGMAGDIERSGAAVVSGMILPAELTLFVGRRRELAEVKRLLSGSRLVTLTGIGVGSARPGCRCAAADLSRAFRDGVYLVELADLQDPALLRHTVAGALGLPEAAREWQTCASSRPAGNRSASAERTSCWSRR
jgi:hypothetical protein